MSEAKNRADWGRAASLQALIANCNRDPKKSKPFTVEDFNPYSLDEKRKRMSTSDTMDIWIREFVKKPRV